MNPEMSHIDDPFTQMENGPYLRHYWNFRALKCQNLPFNVSIYKFYHMFEMAMSNLPMNPQNTPLHKGDSP